MEWRTVLIARPPAEGTQSLAPVRMQVEDQTPMGPWIATLVARFGYPLVDQFGSPLLYRLRCVPEERVLPATGCFADARLPSGSLLLLEPGQMMQASNLGTGSQVFRQVASRRFLMQAGLLSAVSLLGLGSGLMTALSQRPLSQQQATPSTSFLLSLHLRFTQHQQPVRAVSWAPDESMVASAGDDGLALLWKRDGTLVHSLAFPAPVQAIAWSPDGRQVVTASSNTVTFFDAQTAGTLAEQRGLHTGLVTTLGWGQTQAGTMLALSAGTDKKAIVWNGISHQPQVLFERHTTAIEALAVLVTTVVTVSEGGVARVWSAESGQETHGYYADQAHPLRAAAFSSRGAVAAGSNDGLVYLWRDGRTCMRQIQDVFGWHCIDGAIRLQGHTGAVRSLAFSPDATLLATAGEEKKLIIWSMLTLLPLLIQEQEGVPVALSWSPSGQWLAGALGPQVVLWQVHLAAGGGKE